VTQFLTRIIGSIVLLMIFSTANAYYSMSEANYSNKNKISSRHLIIKLSPDWNITLSKNQKSITVTGLTEFDSLSEKYSINNISKLSTVEFGAH